MAKRILELDNKTAKYFLLKGDSYCNIDLPPYFDFCKLIQETNTALGKRTSVDSCCADRKHQPKSIEHTNYSMLANKDGQYTWRPLELIHPVLYCLLVNTITQKENWKSVCDRFKEYVSNERIKCYSIPIMSESKKSDKAETVTNWWSNIEQESLKLGLQYEYILITDITDCYGAIYTHSISWALHTKEKAKQPNGDLLGNKIDAIIRNMRYGQTNGIPQGSVLMDFIAEIVLGAIDEELTAEINKAQIVDYQIIRYRDDYRIFSNNPQELGVMLKLLTEILIQYGLKLNSSKTTMSADIISSSLKPDKLYYNSNAPIYARNKYNMFSTIQQELLYIYNLSQQYPNSGMLSKLMMLTYKKRVISGRIIKEDIEVLISIITELIYKNPRLFSIGFALIGALLNQSINENKQSIVDNVLNKLKKLPNTCTLQLWMQRMLIPLSISAPFTERICHIVDGQGENLWESSWLEPKIKDRLDLSGFINWKKVKELSPIFEMSEINLFFSSGEDVNVE